MPASEVEYLGALAACYGNFWELPKLDHLPSIIKLPTPNTKKQYSTIKLGKQIVLRKKIKNCKITTACFPSCFLHEQTEVNASCLYCSVIELIQYMPISSYLQLTNLDNY